jgi:hypothetical protein
VLSSCLCFCIHEWETLFLLSRVPVYFQVGATVNCLHEISLFRCSAKQATIWFVNYYRVSGCHFVADKQMILTWKVAVSSMFSGSVVPWYLATSVYRCTKRPPEKERRKRLTYLISSRGQTKGMVRHLNVVLTSSTSKHKRQRVMKIYTDSVTWTVSWPELRLH